jgi:hypothetical protein
MRTFLVSYADGPPVHEANQRALVRSAAGKGIDAILSYRRRDLAEEFQRAHRHILDQRRGAGYWLWKPYVILDCMRRADEGDIIIYLDAGALILAPLDPLIEQADRFSLVLIKNNPRYLNAHWTRRDCFVLTGTDAAEYHHTPQLDASCLVVKRTGANRGFVETWLEYCTDDRVLTDRPNECGLPNLPDFVQHRADQSVLSLLYWRERGRLDHLLCERTLKNRYFLHHRRRRATIPIRVWWYRDRIRRVFGRGRERARARRDP